MWTKLTCSIVLAWQCRVKIQDWNLRLFQGRKEVIPEYLLALVSLVTPTTESLSLRAPVVKAGINHAGNLRSQENDSLPLLKPSALDFASCRVCR